MIEIRFEDENDANKMYEHLINMRKNKNIGINGSTVTIHIPSEEAQYVKDIFIPAFVQFIVKMKEEKWILSILEQTFLYRDQEERNQILHIVHSILDGKRRDIPHKKQQEERESILVESLQEFVQSPVSFSFESYVRFRLKEYRSYLIRLTELAIDEYKLEQEYQDFVEMLRQYVSKRKPRLPCVHLVYNGSFIFYDERGFRLNQEKLVQYMDENISYKQELYIDTNVIAPLLSIAPKTIYLYTAHTDHNMIITIRNVFQERVIVYNVGEFEKRIGK